MTELIQNDLNTNRLKKELTAILNNNTRLNLFNDYYELEKKLGGKGASETTAKLIFESINKTK